MALASIKIKDKGIFNLGDLYSMMKHWLDLNGFGDETKSFREEKYVERIKGDSKNIDIRWKAEKIINDYFSCVIKIEIMVLGLKEVELEIEGRKISTNKAEISISIKSDLITDRQKKWHPFLKRIYENTIIKDRISSYKEYYYNKTYSFAEAIKEFLEINRA